jgi:hypothetical protein
MTNTDTNTDNDSEPTVLDRAAIDRDIAAGAKAFKELLQNAALDWTHWSATILGLRGLRSLAYERAISNNMKSQAYRDAMTYLLGLRKYSIYDQIDKQTRSDCYRLMDRLEDVDAWYAAKVSTADKLKWRHPSTIAKHCPKEYLSGGLRKHNKPPDKLKRSVVSAETERLKALLIKVIKRLVQYEPGAIDLLDQIHLSDPDDPLGEAQLETTKTNSP